MNVYYNEIDDYCCDWMSNLMDAGAITPGTIDNRSVEDIEPDDLIGYDRVHLFAGIGVWEYAFLQSGLSAYSGIWTGSAPCQPFSAAGQGKGTADERHLWPAMLHLAKERRPSAVLGEQVASKDGLAWLDIVSADLEGESYAFGAGDLCAAGFGAPHIRQRSYWSAFGVEHSGDDRLQGRVSWRSNPQWQTVDRSPGRDGAIGSLDYTHGAPTTDQVRAGRELHGNASAVGGLPNDISERWIGGPNAERPDGEGPSEWVEGAYKLERDGQLGSVPDADCQRSFSGAQAGVHRSQESTRTRDVEFERLDPTSNGTGPTNGFWRVADWLSCRDGKWRAVEPGTFPLAHGASARVGRLRAYGNAIVAPQAIEFCRSVREFIEAINSDI